MEIILEQNETLVIDRPPAGMRVTCRSGAFWLTQSGDPRDYPLTPGGSVTFHGRGRLVAWALQAGTCALSAPQEGTAPTPLQVQLHPA